jgi:hypothetical protein
MIRMLLYLVFVIGFLEIDSLTIKSRLIDCYGLLGTGRGCSRL